VLVWLLHRNLFRAAGYRFSRTLAVVLEGWTVIADKSGTPNLRPAPVAATRV
jgi:hypothetical protein